MEWSIWKRHHLTWLDLPVNSKEIKSELEMDLFSLPCDLRNMKVSWIEGLSCSFAYTNFSRFFFLQIRINNLVKLSKDFFLLQKRKGCESGYSRGEVRVHCFLENQSLESALKILSGKGKKWSHIFDCFIDYTVAHRYLLELLPRLCWSGYLLGIVRMLIILLDKCPRHGFCIKSSNKLELTSNLDGSSWNYGLKGWSVIFFGCCWIDLLLGTRLASSMTSILAHLSILAWMSNNNLVALCDCPGFQVAIERIAFDAMDNDRGWWK